MNKDNDVIKELIILEKKKFLKNPTILNYQKMDKNIDNLKAIKWKLEFIEKEKFKIKKEINNYEILKGLNNRLLAKPVY